MSSAPRRADSSGWRRRREAPGRGPAPAPPSRSAFSAGKVWLRVAPPRSAATRIGTCSRESPRFLALPPRRRGLRSSFRSPLKDDFRLDDPGKPVRRLAHRRQKAVAPAMRRARRNPAARGRRLDRLAFGKRGAKGKPALLMVKPGQRRARERAEGLAALLALEAAKTARLAPLDRPASAAMRTAPLVIHAQLDERGRAFRRSPCAAPPSTHRRENQSRNRS